MSGIWNIQGYQLGPIVIDGAPVLGRSASVRTLIASCDDDSPDISNSYAGAVTVQMSDGFGISFVASWGAQSGTGNSLIGSRLRWSGVIPTEYDKFSTLSNNNRVPFAVRRGAGRSYEIEAAIFMDADGSRHSFKATLDCSDREYSAT
ncbi:hypothetical protein MTP03_41150 [Tsukamurella sp. PLM1]|nr:hypothetical protein MTP03_41150 [Tsukamurella sp. PLM1]